ncbi:alpha-galactosidase [Danxiaibacter flavus]|uniref:Alpha-galactosidase n=1 Tax=Danxiaibacter flavus TaxID=3049108 RepID=A0ABV3ZMT0_9BACT|nr:alpha-galactosidase [Chitinophagaceae bacterium DXS]
MKKLFFCAWLLIATGFSYAQTSGSPAEMFLSSLKKSRSKVVLADGNEAGSNIVAFTRDWQGNICHFLLTNKSSKPQRIKEVVVFDFNHGLPATTPVYGEAFQMLAQNGGTLGNPTDLGTYPDRKHYKIPEPEGLRTSYGMFTIQLADGERILLGSTSCNKFISRFSYDRTRMRISFDCEDIVLQPGQSWKLEEIMVTHGKDREKLYDEFTKAISQNHPRLQHDPAPNGWCSWYCFGPEVTAKNVDDNTDWIAKNLPAFQYIQLDDGYQPQMGDWLDEGNAFGGKTPDVLKQIRDKGLQPAIWVAPFIASPKSRVLKEHPDWFVKDEKGQPLSSDKIGFGGWRIGPWYVLDGTNPAVQQHLTEVFRTMHEKWGVTYFKLDANYWGSIHGGVHYDKNATRVEAYRKGMEAVMRGAGDAFLLGCNHPIWPSLGLIHGSRSSMDIDRSWHSFKSIGKENLLRGWQNGRLWWNDPDCLLLIDANSKDSVLADGKTITTGLIPENEFLFHAATIYASGGMVLSGDDLTKITPHRLAILRKLAKPTGVAARFENENFEVGKTLADGHTTYTLFNWDDKPAIRTIHLEKTSELVDHITGESLGKINGAWTVNLQGRSSRIIEVKEID